MATTGWQSTNPAPNQKFEDNLESKNGRLFFFGMDLAQLCDGKVAEGPTFPGNHQSLEISYLPAIRSRVTNMIQAFARGSAKLGYTGKFTYCYASKANAAEAVMRAAREAGAHQETSACYDLYVLIHLQKELLPQERMVVCNGFKLPGSPYARLLCQLIVIHPSTVPIIDDESEVDMYAGLKTEHGEKIMVGVRLKCWGKFTSASDMSNCDSRFGFTMEQAERVGEHIATKENLEFKVLHAMVGSPVPIDDVVKWKAPLEAYARFHKRWPTMDTFDFGGGMPSRLVLSEVLDYDAYVESLLRLVQSVCAEFGVPVPHLIGEFGRYTVTDHGCSVFKVLSVRDNSSPTPYYIINGSVMSSFPDTWALKERFTCLPLNHLDKSFRPAKIGGATCDSDDMYPPHYTETKLYLPDTEAKDLWVGFFNVGAYQEMLGGVGGAKHCGIPESDHLIIDMNKDGELEFDLVSGQSMDVVCKRLGYQFAHHHA